MTPSQKSALLERCKFNMTMRIAVDVRSSIDKQSSIHKTLKEIFAGGRHENARLLPIIATLLEISSRLSEALDGALDEIDNHDRLAFKAGVDALAFEQAELAKLLDKGDV